MDLEDGVACVVLPGEERVLPQLLEGSLERVRHLGNGRLVLAELEERLRVVVLGAQRLVALELPAKPRMLGRDARRARLLVPEPRGAHLLLELGAAPG